MSQLRSLAKGLTRTEEVECTQVASFVRVELLCTCWVITVALTSVEDTVMAASCGVQDGFNFGDVSQFAWSFCWKLVWSVIDIIIMNLTFVPCLRKYCIITSLFPAA